MYKNRQIGAVPESQEYLQSAGRPLPEEKNPSNSSEC